MIARDAARVLGLIAEVAENSPDFTVILRELLSWLHRLAIAQVVPDAIDNSQGDRKQVQNHAGSLNAETLQLYYQIALKGKEDMPYALDPRSGLEMTLLRMLAFAPVTNPSAAPKPERQEPEQTLERHNPIRQQQQLSKKKGSI